MTSSLTNTQTEKSKNLSFSLMYAAIGNETYEKNLLESYRR
jgi:hypothetical protein